jgi:hypothetical protein
MTLMAGVLWMALAGITSPIEGQLDGLDTVPTIDTKALSSSQVVALVAVAIDDEATVVARARAIRILGQRRDPAAVSALTALWATLAGPTSPSTTPTTTQSMKLLKGQLLIARAEQMLLVDDGDAARAATLARTALGSDDDAEASAAVLVLFFLGGAESRAALEATKPMARAAVAGAIAGRLRQWSRSGAWRRVANALVPAGPPATRPGHPNGETDVLER